VILSRCTVRRRTSTTNSTYSRVRPTVSTVKKSVASRPLTWLRRNWLQVGPPRRGAGEDHTGAGSGAPKSPTPARQGFSTPHDPWYPQRAGLTLIQLAFGFVLRHPAITAPIIGPRNMERLESQLAAADVVLSDDVLDRIDTIVPPGLTINPAENGWVSPSLQPTARRR
jgi:Aldo/keto reductase family